MTRRYDNSRRAQQAAQTQEDILAATERLLARSLLDDITLEAIAREAGTTVQTVLRHMESRDGCFSAVAREVAARVREQRGNAAYDSIEAAIADLTDHYEAEGRLILNLLAQERDGNAFVAEMMRKGRAFHRRWVRRCFARDISRGDTAEIDALVVATDIYAWKLLRLDLGRSARATRRVMSDMVTRILEAA